ncbi:MAG TPA: DUF6713 family protein [Polyangiaceae bacterium]|nr:DUF6713 family protein [Polyangiaceae bacterium]
MNTQTIATYAFFANFSALTLHEMNAITWKEWRVFGITDDVFGERVFILAHFPLYFLLLSLCTRQEARTGRFVSMAVSTFLIFHLLLHHSARAEGYFTDAFGFGLIVLLAVTALIQLSATLFVTPEVHRRILAFRGADGGKRSQQQRPIAAVPHNRRAEPADR